MQWGKIELPPYLDALVPMGFLCGSFQVKKPLAFGWVCASRVVWPRDVWKSEHMSERD